jgi:hypothetical protein
VAQITRIRCAKRSRTLRCSSARHGGAWVGHLGPRSARAHAQKARCTCPDQRKPRGVTFLPAGNLLGTPRARPAPHRGARRSGRVGISRTGRRA